MSISKTKELIRIIDHTPEPFTGYSHRSHRTRKTKNIVRDGNKLEKLQCIIDEEHKKEIKKFK